MPSYAVTSLILLGGSCLIGGGVDVFVQPRGGLREKAMLLLRVLPILCVGSFLLLLTGSLVCALSLTCMMLSAVVTASNLKLRLLNEPLVFSDFALLLSFFRYPRFYLQGIPWPVRWVCVLGGGGLVYLFIRTWSGEITPRLVGLGWFMIAAGWLCLLLARTTRPAGPAPALWADIRKHGLLPVLILYALRCWRLPVLAGREPLPHHGQAPESLLIIQCESYADPQLLNPQWEELPFLAQARREAWQWGALKPSGFGAYTMRSEYGVLCGGDEAVLSYRRFDPFLTADQTASHALPHRLKAFFGSRLFLHPYDLRFFRRDKLSTLWGFTDIVGRERFTEEDRIGPYTGDAALTAFLLDYMQKSRNSLMYCVTIENHGPWKTGRIGQRDGRQAWYQHARNSDAMLGQLLEGIKSSGRDVMLVFFGDHRPAFGPLPCTEGVERTTPYVILRPNAPEDIAPSGGPVDLTPAELHETILAMVAQGTI